MFVNADIGPMTGQTLPMISHGTSAFLCFCAAFGVILSLSRIAARRIAEEARLAASMMGGDGSASDGSGNMKENTEDDGIQETQSDN